MADIQQITPAMEIAEREVARTLRREKVSRTIRYVILLFVGLLMLYPLVWMFSASFKPNHEIFTTLSLWPAHATWDGFINGWKTGTEYNFGHYMLNTFKYVIPKVLLTIISSTIVAYGCPLRNPVEEILVRHAHHHHAAAEHRPADPAVPDVP
jgi:oligogalacturonide transport system permease protein